MTVESSLELRPAPGVPVEDLPPVLAGGPVRLSELERQAGEDGVALVELYALVHSLADNGLVILAAGAGGRCLAELRPMAPGFRLAALPSGPLALSRFAHVRAVEGGLIVETPLGVGSIRILHPAALTVLGELASGVDVLQGAERPGDVRALLELLVSNGAAGPGRADGFPAVDQADSVRQWEFHDLLFHHASRLGRHDREMGATFRFLGQLEPVPPLPEGRFEKMLELSRPLAPPRLDSGIADLLARRDSVRTQGLHPITLHELSEFLFHTTRVVGVSPGFTSRPYASGGASYELETYVVVDRCAGLEAGFYYYDALRHGLAFVNVPDRDTQALLDDAYRACAQTCRTQVLLVIASRFHRVAWKYAGIAYATTLKNVGALYTTMYLVATAMGLASCALGVGDSAAFCRLAGTDPYVEASVGEFMLGSRAL